MKTIKCKMCGEIFQAKTFKAKFCEKCKILRRKICKKNSYERNKEKNKEYSKKYREKHKEEYKNYFIKRRQNMTPEQRESLRIYNNLYYIKRKAGRKIR